MDQPPKPITNPSILHEIEQTLSTADRCIELARRERERLNIALRELAAREHQVLEPARQLTTTLAQRNEIVRRSFRLCKTTRDLIGEARALVSAARDLLSGQVKPWRSAPWEASR